MVKDTKHRYISCVHVSSRFCKSFRLHTRKYSRTKKYVVVHHRLRNVSWVDFQLDFIGSLIDTLVDYYGNINYELASLDTKV